MGYGFNKRKNFPIVTFWKFVGECTARSANGFQKKMGWFPLYTSLALELKEHRGVSPHPSSQTGWSWWEKVPERRRATWTQPGVTGEDHVDRAGPAVRAEC